MLEGDLKDTHPLQERINYKSGGGDMNAEQVTTTNSLEWPHNVCDVQHEACL